MLTKLTAIHRLLIIVFQREFSSLLVPKPIILKENEPFVCISIITVYLRKIYLRGNGQIYLCVCHDCLWENSYPRSYRGADKSLTRPRRKQARKHVRDARDFNNIESRAVIRVFFWKGEAPKEILAILTEILASFLPGQDKDLSASLYVVSVFLFLCRPPHSRGSSPRYQLISSLSMYISGLNTYEKRRISCFCLESKHDFFVSPSRSDVHYKLRLLLHCYCFSKALPFSFRVLDLTSN